MKAYAVMHGQTDFDAEGRIIGAGDPSLNDTGRGQALDLAEQLKSKEINMILSPPQLRTQETAEIIAEGIGLEKSRITKGLKLFERSFGDLDGKKNDEVDINALISFFSSTTPEGGEHVKETVNRVFPYMNNMVKLFRTKTMLLVVPEYVLHVLFWFFNGYPKMGHEEIISVEIGKIYEFETDNIPPEIKDFTPLSLVADSDDGGGGDDPGRLLSQEEIDALIAEMMGG